jgi:SAM-dependent methyltransferase
MDPTRAAYEALAPIYDELTYRNDYEMWLGALLPELERHGLRRGRALDAGCGTGRAFEPLLRRGWELWGCDLSPAMLEQAREKYGDAVALEVADIRELPRLGEFDLVLALNDVINYQLEDGDLERALAGMRENLAPHGLIVFDSNTLCLFRASFVAGEDEAIQGEWRWRGMADAFEPGGVHAAEVSGRDLPAVVHRQRHYGQDEILVALRSAGLEPLAALGQSEEEGRVVLSEPPDEERDYKIIHIARRADRAEA